MKKLNHLFFLLSLLLLFTCDMQQVEPENIPQDGPVAMKAKALNNEMPIVFEGITRFTAYSILEHRWIKDADSGGPNATAILSHISGHDYLLEITETLPFPPFAIYRKMSIEAKITPGGIVMFAWPEEWEQIPSFANPTLVPHTDIVGQIKSDMGYEIRGQGVNKGTINYKGTFNGEQLVANANFNAKQVQPGTFAPFFTEIVDGPIKVEFLLDLTVVPG